MVKHRNEKHFPSNLKARAGRQSQQSLAARKPSTWLFLSKRGRGALALVLSEQKGQAWTRLGKGSTSCEVSKHLPQVSSKENSLDKDWG